MWRLQLLLWTLLLAAGADAQVEGAQRVEPSSTYRTHSIESMAPERAQQAKNVAAEPAASPAFLLDQYRLERRSRYANSGRALSARDQNALDAQLAELEAQFGHTPAYAFARWEHNGYLSTDYARLEQVSATVTDASLPELDRTAAEVVHACIYPNASTRNAALNKLDGLYASDASSNTLHKNALNSAQANGVLITHGFTDTFSLLQHQRRGLRTDVTVVHLDWLRNPDYAKRIYGLLGAAYTPTDNPDDHLKTLAKAAKTSTRPLYLSTTLPAQALKKLDGDLYPEGVLLRCHKPPAFDNILSTVTWWEQRADRSQIRSGAAINRNYLIALSVLNNFYTQKGENDKSTEVQQLLTALTPKTEQRSRVKQVTTY